MVLLLVMKMPTGTLFSAVCAVALITARPVLKMEPVSVLLSILIPVGKAVGGAVWIRALGPTFVTLPPAPLTVEFWMLMQLIAVALTTELAAPLPTTLMAHDPA